MGGGGGADHDSRGKIKAFQFHVEINKIHVSRGIKLFNFSHFIYKLNVAKIMSTYVREELPTPLQSIFRFDRNTHAYNTRLHDNKYRIESKRWRTIVASQSILYQGPKIWNDIPLKYYLKKNDHDAGYVVSVSCFTTRLVKYLCSSYDT